MIFPGLAAFGLAYLRQLQEQDMSTDISDTLVRAPKLNVPAMYDPGPAGFGDPTTWVAPAAPEPTAFDYPCRCRQCASKKFIATLDQPAPVPSGCRRKGGKCGCSGLEPCEATMPKSWCLPVDLTRFRLVYLGSPYTKYAAGIEQAFRDVSAIAAEMMLERVKVYSPIMHGHPMSKYGNVDPLNHELWLPFDQAMMDAAEAMVIADMPGWQDSYGVKYEIDYFRRAGKPVYFRAANGDVSLFRG